MFSHTRGGFNMKNDTTITDFFYQLLSNRVSNKIRSSGKTYHQIYCASSKMLSWICSNTIYKKYNPYLITDSVMDSSYYGGQIMRLIYIFPICTTHYLLIWSLFNRRSITNYFSHIDHMQNITHYTNF